MADKESSMTLSDLIAPKQVKPIPGGPELKEALQGMTFGFGEEALAAGRSLIPGQPSYEEAVKAERQQLREYEETDPLKAAGYQMAGAVAPAIVTGGMGAVKALQPAAKAAERVGGMVSDLTLKAIEKYSPGLYQSLPEFIKMGISGAEIGGKFGAGGAEKIEDVPQAVLGGTVTGGSAGLALGGIVNVAGPAFRTLFGNPETQAARKIAAALEADKTTPEELIEKMKKSGKGAEVTVADVAGENVQALMRGAAGVPGDARQATTKFLDERQKQQYNRIVKDIEQTMTGKRGVDINEVKRSLDKIKKESSAPFYKNADKVKIENTEELATLINAMPKSVIADGKEALRTMRQPIPNVSDQLEEVVTIPVRDRKGNIINLKVKPETNDFAIYKLIKEGLDDAIDKQQDSLGKFSPQGTRLIELKKDFLAYLDKVNPDYGQARKLYAGPYRSEKMIDKGRKVFNMDPTNVAYEFNQLNPSEREFFRLGAAQAMKDILSGKGSMVDKAKALFDKPEMIDALRPIFPSEAAFRVFANRMETEQLMARTRGFVAPRAGSQTAPRESDIGELGRADIGFLSPLLKGDFQSAALQLAPTVYGKTTGLTPPVTSSIQQSLLTPGVTSQQLAEKLALARKAEEQQRKVTGAMTKGYVAPYALPGATEQYPR